MWKKKDLAKCKQILRRSWTEKILWRGVFLKIHNRRYARSKYKLMKWIKNLNLTHCQKRTTFFDVLGGTGVVTAEMLDVVQNAKILRSWWLRKKYVKTYYAHYNKEAYLKLRADFNNNHDLLILYLLLIYGFNHMIRFNSAGQFNLPGRQCEF